MMVPGALVVWFWFTADHGPRCDSCQFDLTLLIARLMEVDRGE